MSNPYPGYGQQPPQGFGGYPPVPGQPQYPVQTGQSAPLPPPNSGSSGRRGTSRALPIMVAAGLAVGVCGGLVLVLGTGESDAASDKKSEVPEVSDKQDGDKPDDGKEVAAVTPDAAVPPPPPDAAPEPKTRKVTITFDVEPSDAKVTVDGKEIAGKSYTIELEREQTKKVEIVAKASGHKIFKEERTIDGDDTIDIELEKRSTRSSGSSRRNSGNRGNSGGNRGSGGLIDF